MIRVSEDEIEAALKRSDVPDDIKELIRRLGDLTGELESRLEECEGDAP